MFRKKRFFRCPPDSGVFVSLDKLTVQEDSDRKSSQRKSEDEKGKLIAWKGKITEIPKSVFGSKTEGQTQEQRKVDSAKCFLKIDQPVAVFLKDKAVRGSVRYVGGDKDRDGRWYIIVGVELVSWFDALLYLIGLQLYIFL